MEKTNKAKRLYVKSGKQWTWAASSSDLIESTVRRALVRTSVILVWYKEAREADSNKRDTKKGDSIVHSDSKNVGVEGFVKIT